MLEPLLYLQNAHSDLVVGLAPREVAQRGVIVPRLLEVQGAAVDEAACVPEELVHGVRAQGAAQVFNGRVEFGQLGVRQASVVVGQFQAVAARRGNAEGRGQVAHSGVKVA